MLSLSPDEFEEFVADVWAARGYDTTVTQSSNDAGKDVIAKKDGRRVGIQVKRYRSTNRIGGPEIQQYGSLLHDEAIDEVGVVTSSTFTNAAYRRAQEIGIELVDGERLLTLADQYKGRSQTKSGNSESKPSTSSSTSNPASLLFLPLQFAAAVMTFTLKFAVWTMSLVLKLSIAYFAIIFKILLWPFRRGGDS